MGEKRIRNLLEDISAGKIVLPAIQRKLVWKEDQIICLLDSLMRKFPIGDLLFWEKPKGCKMHRFVEHYSEKDDNGYKSFSGSPDYAVLDGQQRLSALYIAFWGSYAPKIKYKKSDNPDAYPQKYAYLNLDSSPNDEEYTFRFFSDSEKPKGNWIRLLDVKDDKKLAKYKRNNPTGTNSRENLDNLCSILKTGIYVYEVTTNFDINEVAEIFKRINSGGTDLSKTDFIFSTFIASWPDGRDKIEEIIEGLKGILGSSKKIDSDFVLRNLMYISDLDLKMNVKSISSKNNIEKIQEEWIDKKNAIQNMARLIQKWGFDFSDIIASSSLLPISYYCKKIGGKPDKEDERKLLAYFILAQLKKIFGSTNSDTLKKIRKKLKNIKKRFPLDDLKDLKFTGNRSLSYNDDDINEWLEYDYVSDYKYCNLLLVYLQQQSIRKGIVLNLDHLHPQSSFKERGAKGKIDMGAKLKKLKSVSVEDKVLWMEMCDQLPNLQLLEKRHNQEKSNRDLESWVSENEEKIEFVGHKKKGFFSLEMFQLFFDERKQNMRKIIKQRLREA